MLDDEYTQPEGVDDSDFKFLRLVALLNEKKINSNEFFEEDIIVQKICASIFQKIIRNSTKELNSVN